MNSFEFGKPDLESTTEYDGDYSTNESGATLSFMEHEAERKLAMEEDAVEKAKRIESGVWQNSEIYQRMIYGISSTFDSDKTTIDTSDDIDSVRRDFLPDYLINENCLRLNYDGMVAICQAVSDGIFDFLGLDEDKRPALILDENNSGEAEGELGTFKEPGAQLQTEKNGAPFRINFSDFIDDSGFDDARVEHLAKKNGFIKIYLSSFGKKPDVRAVLSTLEHECFHAYQFNCRRGTMPIGGTMMAAYHYGYDQYINAENDFEGYYDQGYESSARKFSEKLVFATDRIIRVALKQSMRGESNG